MGIYHHSKEIEHWKKLQNLKYSIFRNNDIIIKIRFLEIMPIYFKTLCQYQKRNNDIKNNVASTVILDLVSLDWRQQKNMG